MANVNINHGTRNTVQFVGDRFGPGINFPIVPVDETAPVLENATPADGAELATTDGVGFDVYDEGGNLERTPVFAYFPAAKRFEVVYFPAFAWDGGARAEGFAPGYTGTRTVIEEGTRFRFANVVRENGWPAPPVFVIDPIDAVGNGAE